MIKLFTHALELTCSHTLARPELPSEQIESFYSVCGKPHGHSYRLEITHDLSQSEKGFAEEIFTELKKQTEKFLLDTYSGQDLNQIFSNTAGEALAPQFLKKIKEHQFGRYVTQLAIQETAKNRFESYWQKPTV